MAEWCDAYGATNYNQPHNNIVHAISISDCADELNFSIWAIFLIRPIVHLWKEKHPKKAMSHLTNLTAGIYFIHAHVWACAQTIDTTRYLMEFGA